MHGDRPTENDVASPGSDPPRMPSLPAMLLATGQVALDELTLVGAIVGIVTGLGAFFAAAGALVALIDRSTHQPEFLAERTGYGALYGTAAGIAVVLGIFVFFG